MLVNRPSRVAGSQPSTVNLGALLLVVVVDATNEAVHEDRHRRNVDAAESADDARLRHAGGEIAGEEGRFVGREDLAENVGDGRVIGEVDDREFGVGVGFGRRLGGVAEQEADGDDQVAISRRGTS